MRRGKRSEVRDSVRDQESGSEARGARVAPRPLIHGVEEWMS